MPYVDFSHVHNQVSIEQVAAWLGLELAFKNNKLRGPCPVNDGPRARHHAGRELLVLLGAGMQKRWWHNRTCRQDSRHRVS